jgi:hypothetical protein
MSKKEALELIQNLPDDVSTDDIMYELYVKEKILSSMKKIEDGKGVPHEEAKERFSKWLV